MIQRLRGTLRRPSPLLALGGLLIWVLAPCASALAQLTELVSIATTGQQGNDISGRFAGPDINDDGQIVVFDSQATTLVPGDTNLRVDVFVRDRTTGITDRVSVSTAGAQANGTSTRPGIDAAGNMVVFDSDASNLVTGDTNQLMDVFVHTRSIHVTERVSVSSAELQGNNASYGPTISADGRLVCLVSLASNLVPDDTNNVEDIFVRDLLAGTTERVSLSSGGEPANSSCTQAAISPGGRWVAFISFATNLVPDDTNDLIDIFIHDRQSGLTERVNLSSDEEQANASGSGPTVSEDGRFVAFYSDATNLVPDDTNDLKDVFVHDRVAGTTERVSISTSGEQGDGNSPDPAVRGFIASSPQITPDGRYVTFFSSSGNLVPGDTNTCPPVFQIPGRCPDVFVRDRVLGTTERVNLSSAGAQANDRTSDPVITPSGQIFAFFSAAGNLVSNDNNPCPPIFPVNCADIFVRESASTTSAGDAGLEGVASARLSMTARPNPTDTSLDLTIAGPNISEVSIVVYDVAGRLVRRLHQGKLETSTVRWDGADDQGRRVEPGVYFCRVLSGGRVAVEKVLLLQR